MHKVLGALGLNVNDWQVLIPLIVTGICTVIGTLGVTIANCVIAVHNASRNQKQHAENQAKLECLAAAVEAKAPLDLPAPAPAPSGPEQPRPGDPRAGRRS